MNPRVNLIRTTALRNETGACLVNSFLKVVLNSDPLTTSYIEFSHKTFENKDIKTILKKFKNDWFNHIPHFNVAIPTLIGLYCDMFYTYHNEDGEDSMDIRNRILYCGSYGDINEDNYKNRLKTNTIVAPRYDSFIKMCISDIDMHKDIISFTKQDTDYVCTDMIYEVDNETHVVYYNCIEQILQDNDNLFYVPHSTLETPKSIYVRKDITDPNSTVLCKNISLLRDYYRPILYHYQNIKGFKTIYNKITQHNTIQNILHRIEFIKAFIGSGYPPYRKVSERYVDVLNIIYKFYKQCLNKGLTKEKFIQAYKTLQHVEAYSFFETYISVDGHDKFASNYILEQVYDSL